ncbi:hypothetical protein SMICM304S_02076 [Streptomyces microflavus]
MPVSLVKCSFGQLLEFDHLRVVHHQDVEGVASPEGGPARSGAAGGEEGECRGRGAGARQAVWSVSSAGVVAHGDS